MTRVGERHQQLAALWRWSAQHFDTSPLYAALAAEVAEGPEVLDLVLEAPPEAHLPLVLLAAVHFLVLGDPGQPLAQRYRGESDGDAGLLFHEFCLGHRDQLLEVMARRRIQTNEVGRSALIGPALTALSEAHGAPLHLVDVGTSAGLNLWCDRYLLDYGPAGRSGPADSAVRVACEVRAGHPPVAQHLGPFASRTGIERDPPDLGDPDDVRWLLACTWPDSGRLERARRAIDMAREDPPPVRRGDALSLLPGVLAELEGDGLVCVLTTWFTSHLPPPARAEFVELLAAAGRERPLVWLCGDAPGVVELVGAGDDPAGGEVLSAVTFDAAGPHPQLLARVHAHGWWMRWLG